MTSPSRHGFWGNSGFRYIAQSTLVVWDPNSTRSGRYNSESNLNPVTNLYPIICARELELGFTTVTLVNSYSDLSSIDLSQFDHVWDIGYDTVIPLATQYQYRNYLHNYGSLFVLGENANFIDRNDSIADLVQLAGGGSVSCSSTAYGTFTDSVQSQFLLANNSSSITWYAPGEFSQIGTGTAITSGQVAVMWKTGSLSAAPYGAIVAVLDTTFMTTPDATTNLPFFDNLSLCLSIK